MLLEGELVAHSYVFDRMLGEFAAATVVFAKAIPDGEQGVTSTIEDILQDYPIIFPYYTHCIDHSHKHFLWTGPKVEILPQSKALQAIIPLISSGEHLDVPSQEIYTTPVHPITIPPTKKRHN